jgi:uncharacterized protein (TIGR03435 family)
VSLMAKASSIPARNGCDADESPGTIAAMVPAVPGLSRIQPQLISKGPVMKFLLPSLLWCSLALSVIAQDHASPPSEPKADDNELAAPIFQIVIRPSKATKKTESSSSSGAVSGRTGGGGGGAGRGVGGGGGGIVVGGGGGFAPGGGAGAVAGGPPGAFAGRQTYGSSTSGATLPQLISHIYQVSGPHLLVDFEPPEGKFDVMVSSQGGTKNQIDAIYRQAVEAAFKLTAKHEQHDLDAYVLTVKDKEAKGLRPTKVANSSGWRGEVGTESGVNISFKEIADKLERLLKQPVVDETGLNGRYDFELKWDQPDRENTNPEALIKALRDQLGIEATLAKRPIDILVVSQQQPARGPFQFNAGGNGGAIGGGFGGGN